MTLSGVTIVRNGVQFDYPFLESIHSLLPWVDELIVNLDPGEDATKMRLEELCKTHPQGSKVRILLSKWPLDDPEKKRGGQILADQTNLALQATQNEWVLYLQADEVLHEEDREAFLEQLKRANAQPEVQGLVFDYVHFYGSYGVTQTSRSAYRREVRCVRKSSGARSVGDAQSFLGPTGQKLQVIKANARVFHYGWVRPPEAMREKTFS